MLYIYVDYLKCFVNCHGILLCSDVYFSDFLVRLLFWTPMFGKVLSIVIWWCFGVMVSGIIILFSGYLFLSILCLFSIHIWELFYFSPLHSKFFVEFEVFCLCVFLKGSIFSFCSFLRYYVLVSGIQIPLSHSLSKNRYWNLYLLYLLLLFYLGILCDWMFCVVFIFIVCHFVVQIIIFIPYHLGVNILKMNSFLLIWQMICWCLILCLLLSCLVFCSLCCCPLFLYVLWHSVSLILPCLWLFHFQDFVLLHFSRCDLI